MNQASPLKDLAYYENRRIEKLSSGNFGPESPADDRKENKNMLYLSHTRINQNKRGRRQGTADFISPIYSGKLLVLKEKVGQKLRVFHICENSDINTLMGIEKQEKAKMRRLFSKNSDNYNLTIREEPEESKEENSIQDNQRVMSESQFNSTHEKFNDGKTTEQYTNLDTNQDIDKSNPYYRLSSVMNFSHSLPNNLADKETSELMLDLEQLERNENSGEAKAVQEKFEMRLLELDKKIKCGFCKDNYKQNHIIEFKGIYGDFVPGSYKNKGLNE